MGSCPRSVTTTSHRLPQSIYPHPRCSTTLTPNVPATTAVAPATPALARIANAATAARTRSVSASSAARTSPNLGLDIPNEEEPTYLLPEENVLNDFFLC